MKDIPEFCSSRHSKVGATEYLRREYLKREQEPDIEVPEWICTEFREAMLKSMQEFRVTAFV